jgi:peptidoglycan/xylan/chitin deacetylase (PgdA/CDA1 family)
MPKGRIARSSVLLGSACLALFACASPRLLTRALAPLTPGVRPGSVIVLHDANGRGLRTAATLDKVIPRLRERGYRVVTLSELRALEDRSL